MTTTLSRYRMTRSLLKLSIHPPSAGDDLCAANLVNHGGVHRLLILRHLACQHLQPLLQPVLLSVQRFEKCVNPADLPVSSRSRCTTSSSRLEGSVLNAITTALCASSSLTMRQSHLLALQRPSQQRLVRLLDFTRALNGDAVAELENPGEKGIPSLAARATRTAEMPSQCHHVLYSFRRHDQPLIIVPDTGNQQ